MTQYREYRGLYGEPVRVPEGTMAAPQRTHSHAPFPLAAAAARLGKDRDRFALVALGEKWVDSVARTALYKAATFQREAA